MADVIFQQQVQLRQQRQNINEQRRRLMSQQNLRQAQDRNVVLQRQQQLQRLSQAEQQITAQDTQLQELQRQQQGQNQDAINRELQKQIALKTLVEKGKGSSALYSLTRQERAEIEAKASELKGSRERSAGIVAISRAEQSLSSSLSPELRKQIFLQGASGQFNIELPKLESKFQQLTQPQFTPNIIVQQRQPLVVAPTQTFSQQLKGIISQPVPRTRGGGTNIPAQIRKVVPIIELSYSTASAKAQQKLKEFGIGRDSPIFLTEVNVPVKNSAILGDISLQNVAVPSGGRLLGELALGSLLFGLSGSSGQVAVTRYTRNGRVYYVDNTGQVIGSESVEQASKNIAEFKQALDESAIFKKAGSRYYNEPNLRERTRELINKASPQQLKSLKELYKKSGRLDLYNDILAQEKDIIVRTNIQTKATAKAIKDRPAQLTGAGQVTSQFAGTGQYERTNTVAFSRPREAQQTNQMLGLQQTGFQFERLGMRTQVRPTTLVNTISRTSQTTIQNNALGLKSSTQTIQAPSQARILLNLFRTAQQTRQESRQATQQKSQLQFARPTRQGTRLRPPRISFPLKPSGDAISISKVGTEDSFGVGIEVRRRGKFTLIGQESSVSEALMKGFRNVDVTLARSFRLRDVSTGELIDVKQLPFGIRRSKSQAKTFVEESRIALSTGGEKKDIQYFKKQKRRRSLI